MTDLNIDDYYFECVLFHEIEPALLANQAWAGIGALTVDTRRKGLGFKFSNPILHTGLRIATSGVDALSHWNWLKSFSAGLWAAILVTAAGLGVIVKVMEHPYFKKETDFEGKQGFVEGIWHGCASITMTSDKSLRHVGSRIVTLLFWFMILIITTSYTADLIARLGAGTIQTTITILDDLSGASVGIDSEYAGTGIIYGATETIYDEHDEIQTMLDEL
jgi:polar amino acid transport system substrate-binding protein